MSEFLPTGIQLSYLVAVALFFFGLKKLGSPATARRGNIWAAVGMLIAIVATLLDQHVLSYGMIFVGLVIGSIIGAIMAYKVEMTAMPQWWACSMAWEVQPLPWLLWGNSGDSWQRRRLHPYPQQLQRC